jgi:hypothetical protein
MKSSSTAKRIIIFLPLASRNFLNREALNLNTRPPLQVNIQLQLRQLLHTRILIQMKASLVAKKLKSNQLLLQLIQLLKISTTMKQVGKFQPILPDNRMTNDNNLSSPP